MLSVIDKAEFILINFCQVYWRLIKWDKLLRY